MRSELAAALIHEPKVVYLDEPTIGLDLIVKERIRDFIKAQCIAKGMTVILTTHDLGDIEELCKRVIIIDDGRLIYDGPIETIKKRFGKYREITFETVEQVGMVNVPEGAELLSTADRKVQVRFDRTLSSASKVAASVMNQVEVRDFSLSEPELADIVKQIYNGALEREGR
jgi:ABC-2 type transport system ATP-binding protein